MRFVGQRLMWAHDLWADLLTSLDVESANSLSICCSLAHCLAKCVRGCQLPSNACLPKLLLLQQFGLWLRWRHLHQGR